MFELQECQAPSVLLEASRLFWYFSRSDNNKPVMLEEGHLQTTINAIDGRHNLPQVVFQLVVGLSNVALATDAARALIEMGIYESVSKAASANSSHLNLQLASCVLIGHSLRHKWSEAGDEQSEREGMSSSSAQAAAQNASYTCVCRRDHREMRRKRMRGRHSPGPKHAKSGGQVRKQRPRRHDVLHGEGLHQGAGCCVE